MLDPVSLALTTTAVTALASKVYDGAAGAAGEALWQRLTALLGIDAKTEPAELPEAIEAALKRQEAKLDDVVRLLRENPTTAPLVGTIHAQKVVVAQKIDKVEM